MRKKLDAYRKQKLSGIDIGPPKSKDSYRDIPVPPGLRAAARKLRVLTPHCCRMAAPILLLVTMLPRTDGLIWVKSGCVMGQKVSPLETDGRNKELFHM